MKNMFLKIILFLSALFSSTSNACNVNDLCIVDLKGPDSPTGYHCLPVETITTNDFKYNMQLASILIPLKMELEGHFLGTTSQFDTIGFTTGEIARKQTEKEQKQRKSLSMPLATIVTIHCAVFETTAI
ncbi:hypothetical protein JHK87_042573 [Glycine soja]|nr:hypothetical protein JHK87_042573 [Glycine soja]